MYVCSYDLHYNVLLEMMMSVLQEIKGLTKELYFIILSRRKSMQNFRSQYRSTVDGFGLVSIIVYLRKS